MGLYAKDPEKGNESSRYGECSFLLKWNRQLNFTIDFRHFGGFWGYSHFALLTGKPFKTVLHNRRRRDWCQRSRNSTSPVLLACSAPPRPQCEGSWTKHRFLPSCPWPCGLCSHHLRRRGQGRRTSSSRGEAVSEAAFAEVSSGPPASVAKGHRCPLRARA